MYRSPEAVAHCVMDLIKDETDVGQVVKVTYEDGVEYLNYNDVSKQAPKLYYIEHNLACRNLLYFTPPFRVH